MANKIKLPQLTEEQKQEQIKRALIQKRCALAEGAFINLCQNPMAENLKANPNEDLVDIALRLSEKFVEKVYGLECSKD